MAGLVQIVQAPLSLADPTEKDIRISEGLMALMNAECLIPTQDESDRRVKAIGKLNELVRQFVRNVLDAKSLADMPADDTTYRLRTFGSYRLDVHLPGADMDTLIIVVRHIDRKDMFKDLFAILQDRRDVTKLVKVEETRVPIIKFEMDDFEFDLAMVILQCSTIPDDFDITDDRHLRNLDMQSVTSLNGARVTDTIQKVVPTMKTLKFAIRALKLWAKRRGVYKNLLGFLGGIAIEIMTARIAQMYPRALPSKLVYLFFASYALWRWPQPVGLTEIRQTSHDLQFNVWGCPPTDIGDRRHVMPVITPCYPAQNATANVSHSTLKIMKDEFTRGRDITKRIEEGKAEWSELFEVSDPFNVYSHFLQVIAQAATKHDYDAWKGFTEANLRHLVSSIERFPDACLERAHPFQRSYMKARGADEEEPYQHHWYIGLKFDKKDKKRSPNMTRPVREFKEKLLAWQRRKEGMGLTVTVFKGTDKLPDWVLKPDEDEERTEELYEEGVSEPQAEDVEGDQQTAPEASVDAGQTEAAGGGGGGAAEGEEGEEGGGVGGKRGGGSSNEDEGETKRPRREGLSPALPDNSETVKVKIEGGETKVKAQGGETTRGKTPDRGSEAAGGVAAGGDVRGEAPDGGGADGTAANSQMKVEELGGVGEGTAAAAGGVETDKLGASPQDKPGSDPAGKGKTSVKTSPATEIKVEGKGSKKGTSSKTAAVKKTDAAAPAPPSSTAAATASSTAAGVGATGAGGKAVKKSKGMSEKDKAVEAASAALAAEAVAEGGRQTLVLMQSLLMSEAGGDTKGGGTGGGGGVEEAKQSTFMLEREQELRIEVETPAIQIELLTGRAEVFGSELPRNEKITLSRIKVGRQLTRRRQGKSSLARLLINYAVRMGERPVYVDLDVPNGHMTVPGAIGAGAVMSVIGPDESLLDVVPSPLVYFYGTRDVTHNPPLFDTLVRDLSSRLQGRVGSKGDPFGAASGMIFDTFACQAGSGGSYEVLVSAAVELKVEHVIVLEQDKLYADLQRDLKTHNIAVLRLSRSGGVVQHDKQFKKQADRRLLGSYFYGPAKHLSPRHHVLPILEVQIYEIKCPPPPPKDALPIGMSLATRHLEVHRVEGDALAGLENRLLGLSACVPLHPQASAPRTVDVRGLTSSPVWGFVHLVKVDLAARTVTLLSPSSQPLQSPVLIVGDVDFVE